MCGRILIYNNLAKMALTRQKKEELISDLSKQIGDSSLVAFVNFHGLNVALSSQLRSLVRNTGAKYLVSKKTLIKKVLENSGFSGDIPELEGEVALVLSKDEVVEPVKVLAQFNKKNKNAVKMLGGVMNKVYIGQNEICVLATLPSRDVLLSQFLNVINAPMRNMVVVLNGPMRNLVGVLKQIKR